MSVNIHGKEYVTVAERLLEAKDHIKSISTEVLYQSPVVIKATVVTDKGSFTGISAANESKAIEKQSPYEVAETSAVGRALGFAGYGIVERIFDYSFLEIGQTYQNRSRSTKTRHKNTRDRNKEIQFGYFRR